jgi:hypothetical protein
MLATDRSHYAKSNPYMDSPQSIGKLYISKKSSIHIWIITPLMEILLPSFISQPTPCSKMHLFLSLKIYYVN